MHKHINLNEFAGGALLERVNMELGKVLENIQDPNTDATKKRKVTITLDIEPNERRELANIVTTVKSSFAPLTAVTGSLMIGHDGKRVIGKELKSSMPGQYMMDVESGQVVQDDGSPIEELKKEDSVVVDFRKTK